MALEYSIEREPALIKVIVCGELDYLSMDQMWKDILVACEKYDCSSVVGIASIEAPTANDAYDHAGIFDAIGMPPNFHIAWVESNATAVDMAKLAEAVIRNRGLAKGRVFGRATEARRWLAEVASSS